MRHPVADAQCRSLLVLAGIGAPSSSTGRHPIERLTSASTAVAVRSHVPVLVDGRPVLVPLAEADRVMQSIARAAWPDDPSPMEEQAYGQGMEHRRSSDSLSMDMLGIVLASSERITLALQVLDSAANDDDARTAAASILRGGPVVEADRGGDPW